MHVLNTNDELDIKVVYNACTRTENKIPCLPMLVKHCDMLISFFFYRYCTAWILGHVYNSAAFLHLSGEDIMEGLIIGGQM